MDYQLFKWEILSNSFEEGYMMLYEPISEARTQWPNLSETERQTRVEQVLRELFSEGLILFFRAPPVGELDALYSAGVDSTWVLSPEEVDAVLSGSDWRTVPVGEAGVNVWIDPTQKGEDALEYAPEAERLTRYWRGDER